MLSSELAKAQAQAGMQSLSINDDESPTPKLPASKGQAIVAPTDSTTTAPAPAQEPARARQEAPKKAVSSNARVLPPLNSADWGWE